VSRRVVKVELLWFSGCPNWPEPGARVRKAVSLAGATTDVVSVEVTTLEDAERLRLRGSPTVSIDGRDAFAQESGSVGLSCRAFRTPEGCGASRRSSSSSTSHGARHDRPGEFGDMPMMRKGHAPVEGGRPGQHSRRVRLSSTAVWALLRTLRR